MEPGDSYTLNAAAKNSAGIATASIILEGKCGETDNEVADGEVADEEPNGYVPHYSEEY